MKKLLSKGRMIVSFVSIFAILAVSVLSMFVGVTFVASAEDAATEEEETITYPLNGIYDADFTASSGEAVYYTDDSDKYIDIDGTEKDKVVSKLTSLEPQDITLFNGTGTKGDPYIIETANQFAAVVTGNLVDDNDEVFYTNYRCFTVADYVKAFDLSNTDSTVDFSGDMTSAEVKAALADATVKEGLAWNSVVPFMGKLNGNGVEVYGLKATGATAGIIPRTSGNVVVTNLTVKNSYFCGTRASAFIAYNCNYENFTFSNVTLTMTNCSAHNNVVLCDYDGESIILAGVLLGNSGPEAEFYLTNTLVYDNIAEHTTRKITYGIVGNVHRTNSSTINNCIILDSVPHPIYYGSNAFHNSTYTNVYTNMCNGEAWENYDGVLDASGKLTSGFKYVYSYKANGNIDATFNHYNPAGENQTNSGSGYSKTLEGPMYNVKEETLKTATVPDGMDAASWTFVEGSYPTPKVYNLRTSGVGDVWGGKQEYTFFEGDGSSSTPYVITNAEELALMLTSDTQNMYYVLGNDIVINDTSVENWTQNARKWFTSNDVPEFKGVLDGNGYTVSGIYYDGTQAGEYVGLIPVINSPGVVKNLKVTNSSITANNGAAGAVVGAVADKALKVVKFNAITVDDTVKITGNAIKGGIAGKIGYSVAQFSDCITEVAGIFGQSTALAKVYRCVSVNSYPFGSYNKLTVENVYTNISGAQISGVNVVALEQMIGAAAEVNMPGLSFPYSWAVSVADFPTPTGNEASSNGVKSEPWSGAIATEFAGGTGTASDPFLIETAEQLALCVYKGHSNGKDSSGDYFKLTADIYLNDISPESMWSEKIGCNEWFTQRTTAAYNNFKNCVFDGDGYVIYGLFFDHTGPQTEYVRTGLIPMLGSGSTVKNVAVSEAYFNMNFDLSSDCAGLIVGCVEGWNSTNWPMEAKNATANEIKKQDPEFQQLFPRVINCLADKTCYVAALYAGGLVGQSYGALYMENCIFTGSLKKTTDIYYGGTLIGVESSNASTIKDCVSLPQTCDTMAGGNAGQTWRTGTPEYITVEWDDVYYFSTKIQRAIDEEVVKILKPADRVGTAAQEAMPDLDWVDYYYYDPDASTDPNDPSYDELSDETSWLVIDTEIVENGETVTKKGTPVPAVFSKHRDEAGLVALSDTNFTPPETTISFITNTDEIVLEDITAPMYSALELPIITRDGYDFTGWYVFEDLSMEYPKDYFPPRNLQLFAGWEATGVVTNFEDYTDTIWDYDSEQWRLNKPGAKGGYKNAYVRNGAKSMHLLDTNTEAVDCLLNYEQMLVPGCVYTIKFWVTTDKENNPTTLLTLVHNEKPVYLDTEIASENMAVVTGLTVGEWAQYSYTFTAQSKWVSIRATGGSSLYFDDIVIGKIGGTPTDSLVVGTNGAQSSAFGSATFGLLSSTTNHSVTVAALISAIISCAVIVVISKKNLVEVID